MSYKGSRLPDPSLSNAFGRQDDLTEKYRKYTKVAIGDTYYMMCIKKCFANYDTPLNGNEKICLAKCIDRAYDYFALSQDNLNPYKKSDLP